MAGIKGKVVVITGASRLAIGEATALMLAEHHFYGKSLGLIGNASATQASVRRGVDQRHFR